MNKNQRLSEAFCRYELGKAYKRKIGLYERVRENERFFRGEQWSGGDGDLPRPVFNVVRRIVDHLVGSVARAEFSIRYTDESLPFFSEDKRERLERVLSVMSRSAAARWSSRAPLSSGARRCRGLATPGRCGIILSTRGS